MTLRVTAPDPTPPQTTSLGGGPGSRVRLWANLPVIQREGGVVAGGTYPGRGRGWRGRRTEGRSPPADRQKKRGQRHRSLSGGDLGTGGGVEARLRLLEVD